MKKQLVFAALLLSAALPCGAQEIAVFPQLGHSDWVRSVVFSPDGRRVLSGSRDNTTRLWDAETGKEIVQFVGFTDGEWVAITPDGYYVASTKGDLYINVRITTETGGNATTTVTGIDAYRSVFYNPDVIQARIRGLPDPASKALVTIQQVAALSPRK